MAAAATAASNGPRYAPEDPTLPKPWKGLVDGKTGYLYFWNPVTNVTQYEKPGSSLGLPDCTKSVSVSVSSRVQVDQSSREQQQQRRDGRNGEDDHHDGGSKFAANNGGSSQQSMRSVDGHLNEVSDVSNNGSHGGFNMQNSGPNAPSKSLGSNIGSAPSADAYRHQHEITVIGDNVPPPFTSFQSTGFPAELLREVQHAGFSAPTPIQAQSWPIALQNHDIVAVAKTGSGKTLGYLLPGFMHLKRCRNDPKMGPTVLVLSPTRELATQIQDQAVKFGQSSRISCTCLYGGAQKAPQLRDLDQGVDIVVATPGRLNDILEMRRISLSQVSYLVLDEADRMLDMGFEPQIRKIVKEIPARRQTLMYTATWPKEVRKIAAELLVNPVQVNIGRTDELVANKSITQYVEVVSSMEKHKRLEQILRSQEPGSRIIVFCSTKRMCDQLVRNIARHVRAAAIHGDKSQGERDHVLNEFRTGRSPILVATDVAARGLDVKDIRVVVNYDFPNGVEDYVHRIGRTGRAGATGLAYTFFCDQDAKHSSDLIKLLEGANQRVPSELRELSTRSWGMGRARQQWGFGFGGRDGGRAERNDSSYGGRGGRGRSEGGYGGRGYGHEPDRYDQKYHDEDSHGIGIVGKRSRSRSPIKGSGWGYNTQKQHREEEEGMINEKEVNEKREEPASLGW